MHSEEMTEYQAIGNEFFGTVSLGWDEHKPETTTENLFTCFFHFPSTPISSISASTTSTEASPKIVDTKNVANDLKVIIYNIYQTSLENDDLKNGIIRLESKLVDLMELKKEIDVLIADSKILRNVLKNTDEENKMDVPIFAIDLRKLKF